MKRHEITIGRRHEGPNGIGHGGYFCGLVASLAPGIAGVRLRGVVPLDTALNVEVEEEAVQVTGPAGLIADAAGPMPPTEIPAPVAYDEAAATRFEGFDRPGGHPVPRCFGCGDRRREGDGLRLFPGPLAGRVVGGRPLVAAPWIPHPAFFDGRPALAVEYVWAALDCPGGWSLGPAPVKTGTLWARQSAPILPGERYVLLGWHIAPPADASATSRSRLAGSAILDEAGRVCAVSRAVWVLDRG